METKDKTQLIFLILILFALVIFTYTIVVLIKNIELIKQDPIQYGIEKNNFYSCVCYSDYGTIFYNLNQTDYLDKSDQFKKQLEPKEPMPLRFEVYNGTI